MPGDRELKEARKRAELLRVDEPTWDALGRRGRAGAENARAALEG